MPTPTKRGQPERKKSVGIWSSVQPVKEVQSTGLKVNLFGMNGSGKTSLACTFPKPLLLVGFEDGTKSVKNVQGVHFVRVWDSRDLIELSKGVVDKGFKTVVLDTATSLQDLVLKELMGWEQSKVQLAWGTVTKQQYQARAEKTKECLRLFVDVADKNPLNVVILAQQKDHTNKTEEGQAQAQADAVNYEGIIRPFIASSLGRSTCDWLQDNVDYICQTFVRMETKVTVKTVGEGKKAKQIKTERETGKKEFCLRMERSHPVFGAKVRADRNLEIPDVLSNPSYERFVAALEGKLKD